MKRKVTPLSDIEIKKAKSKDQNYKLSDGRGLYVLVTTTGGKLWRFDYSFAGKRNTAAFGTYPEISLAAARERREEFRSMIANGIDPSAEKKSQKIKEQIAAETFKTVALEWHANKKADWSENHAERLLKRLEQDIFPAIGNKRLADITPPELLKLLQAIADRTLETAHRLKIACDMIYRYAIVSGNR